MGAEVDRQLREREDAKLVGEMALCEKWLDRQPRRGRSRDRVFQAFEHACIDSFQEKFGGQTIEKP